MSQWLVTIEKEKLSILKSQGIKKYKSHSPDLSAQIPDLTNVIWDKDGVLKDLHAAIANDKKLVWSKFAKEHSRDFWQ